MSNIKATKLLALVLMLFSFKAIAQVKGIYLTQYTLENTAALTHLIQNAKAAGVNTFVIDLEKPDKRYQANLDLVKQNGIRYVARIVMFPGGGTAEQVADAKFWQSRYRLVQQAVDWGANEIQLDYIRYNTAQKPSSENAKRILEIIKWYKSRLASQNIPLQVDIFGIASFGEAKYIGQNIPLFATSVDAICPMVYPSHYVPYADHYAHPFDTVYDSLASIQDQFEGKMPIKMYAYIELSNYHYLMNAEKKRHYINEQLRAVKEANADGWYAWSPHNRYDVLFQVLQSKN